MKTPMEKYQTDPVFHRGVDMLESLIHEAQYTPSELREMALLASINYEMHRTSRVMYVHQEAEEALKILADIRGGKK
jgi:hypothetical protein